MAAALLLAACEKEPQPDEDLIPEYLGITAEALDDDLVQINVSMTNAAGPDDITDYADCAIAGYTLKQDYGFARHLRTNLDKEGGIWRADAVYTISPSLPEGLMTIDAEVAAQDCKARGIPTV